MSAVTASVNSAGCGDVFASHTFKTAGCGGAILRAKFGVCFRVVASTYIIALVLSAFPPHASVIVSMVPATVVSRFRIWQFAADEIFFAIPSACFFVYKTVSIMAVRQYAYIYSFRQIFINAFFAVEGYLPGWAADSVAFIFAVGADALAFGRIPLGFGISCTACGIAGVAFASVLFRILRVIAFVCFFAGGIIPSSPLA